MFCLKNSRKEGIISAVELDVKHFVTAHLFIININSVSEEIIRWSDGDLFPYVLSLAFIFQFRG